jgi:hypothetical protein
MPIAQSPAHYINSSKGCPSITESFPLVVFLELCATVAALPVVQPHLPASFKEHHHLKQPRAVAPPTVQTVHSSGHS